MKKFKVIGILAVALVMSFVIWACDPNNPNQPGNKTLEEITVSKQPNKVAYTSGEPFNPAGMVVTAHYSDDSAAAVADYVFSPTRALNTSDKTITITYAEGGVTKQATVTVTVTAAVVVPRVLEKIEIATPPTKTQYLAGESFSTAGMVIRATYDNESTSAVSGYTVAPAVLAGTESSVTISYTEEGVTKTVTQAITFLALDSITATTPTKTKYDAGEPFDPAGMVVTAKYSDQTTTRVVPAGEYTLDPAGNLTGTETSVKISYRGKDTTVNIAVVSSIVITAPPTKIAYDAGETFSPAGMVLEVTYSDGSKVSNVTSGFTTSASGNLTTETAVTVSYGGKSATQAITVRSITRLEVTTNPDKTVYSPGERFAHAGMVVTAYYTSGEPKTFSYSSLGGNYGFTIKEGLPSLTLADTKITVLLLGVELEYPITVREYTGLKVTAPPNLLYIAGFESFDPAGMVVTAVYGDGVEAAVTGFNFNPKTALAAGDNTITISYQVGNVTHTTTVTVKGLTLSDIEVTNPPTKTQYINLDTFDKTGMIVEATYGTGAETRTRAVTAYTVPAAALTGEEETVTVSYTEGGITKTKPVDIDVKILDRIEISGDVKTSYAEGDRFSTANMVVTAYFNKGDPVVLTGTEYTLSPTATTALTKAHQNSGVTVTYRNGKTDNIGIQVLGRLSLNNTIWAFGEAGDTVTLKSTLASSVLNNLTLSWESSDEAVATVVNGVVTAVGYGTATVTLFGIHNTDGEDLYRGDCAITFAEPKAITTAAEFRAIFATNEARSGNYYLTGDISFAGVTMSRPVTVGSEPRTGTGGYDGTETGFMEGLGSYWWNEDLSFFNGTFDGRGYALRNITMQITGDGAWGTSIFGTIGRSGVVKNTAFIAYRSLQTAGTTGQQGVVAQNNHGVIQNCYFEDVRITSGGGADVHGNNAVIASFNYSVIDRCVVASAASNGTGSSQLFPVVNTVRRGLHDVSDAASRAKAGDVTNTFARMDVTINGINGLSVTEFAANPAKVIAIVAGGSGRVLNQRTCTFENVKMIWTTTLPTSTTTNADHRVLLANADFSALDPTIWDYTTPGTMPTLIPQVDV